MRVCIPNPAVLVLIKKLGRAGRWVPCFGSHFLTQLPAQRDVDGLVLDAFTLEDPGHIRLLRLNLREKKISNSDN